MSKHTPGPREQEQAETLHLAIVCAHDLREMRGKIGGELTRRAAFIVALDDLRAEMLDALRELVAEFDRESAEAAEQPGCGGINETGGILLARAAIAKATQP